MIRLPEPVLSEMRLMRQEAERLLAEHRKLLPRYNEVSIGGAYIDSLSRGEALHAFLNSLGFINPKKALEAAKETSSLFLSKHNERFSRDYVTQRSIEQDYNYLDERYRRIIRALDTFWESTEKIAIFDCSQPIENGENQNEKHERQTLDRSS